MLREELIFVGTCDIAGHVRGKGFPAREIDARRRKGVGWTHSNLMQTAFGPIWDTPFGTAGDLMIVPDAKAEVRVDFGDGSAPEHFFLGDIRNTDGSPWECCPREFLRRGITAVNDAAGLHPIAAFEQEFGLLKRICGRRRVRAVCQVHGRGRFPSPRRCGSRRIFAWSVWPCC